MKMSINGVSTSWHVAICRPGLALRGADAIAALGCVEDVYAPTRTVSRGPRKTDQQHPWLGRLVLARWPTDDPHAWHDVADALDAPFGRPLVAGILGGWPPAVVPDAAVQRFADEIRSIESRGQVTERPPCASGDTVRLTQFEVFSHVVGFCMWVGAGVVGVRLRLLGRDTVVQVPYGGVERAQRVAARQYGRRR